MSPESRPDRMVSLIEHATRSQVAAILRSGLMTSDLADAERTWRSVREELVASQRRAGRHGGTEHGHWDWARDEKAEGVESGRAIVVGITCGGLWQGLMAVFTQPRPSRSWLPLIGRLLRRPVLYVDYLESAPWNIPELSHPELPKYGGVGTQLLMDAVRLSIETGLRGRVGLHSLPQSIQFYRNRGMRLLIEFDYRYLGLPYFEYTEEQAQAQLSRFE